MNFDNDMEILTYTKTAGTTLYFDKALLPGGEPFSWTFEELNFAAKQQWCQMVRSENERQKEERAKPSRSPAASGASDSRGNPPASDRGGARGSSPQAGATLEEELLARHERAEEEVAALQEQVERTTALIKQKEKDIVALESALYTYKGGKPNEPTPE